MMKHLIAVSVLCALSGLTTLLTAHCEIPCGIYDDHMRVHMIEEHCATIEKGIGEINRLLAGTQGGGAGSNDVNQIVRWTMNKENHADMIQEIVCQYFLTQRIKPEAAEYHKKLELLHGIIISAMKAKQTTDITHVQDIRTNLEKFSAIYFPKGESK